MNMTNQHASHAFRIIGQVSEAYAESDMSDVLLLSCQHLLAPQLAMFSSFFGAGLKPENCLIAGKNYSTNADVVAELRRARCVVAPFSDQFDPLISFDKWFTPRLAAWVKEILIERNLGLIRRIIVLDDGGHMHEAVNSFLGHDPRIAGVEQTSSGKARIERLKIRFNRHMVATSVYKQRDEAYFIGALGADRIMSQIARRGAPSSRILVLGLGTIGRNTALRLYLNHGMEVRVADPGYRDPSRKLWTERANQMFEARGVFLEYGEAMTSLEDYDVIIGASGSQVLSARQVHERLHPRALLISMSSGDGEFPATEFRKRYHTVHSDCVMEHRCLANAGFPITFRGAMHEIHPLQIELTMALLQASVMDLSTHEDGRSPGLGYVVSQAHASWRRELAEEGFVSV